MIEIKQNWEPTLEIKLEGKDSILLFQKIVECAYHNFQGNKHQASVISELKRRLEVVLTKEDSMHFQENVFGNNAMNFGSKKEAE